MTVYVRYHRGEISYTDEERNTLSPRPGRHRLILSLRECFVFTVDLPPLDKKNLAPLIEKRLPDLLPMASDGLVWDIRRRGNTTWLFLISDELKSTLLEDWGSRSVIQSTAIFLADQPEDGSFQFDHPGGKDIYFIKEGVLDHTFFLEEGHQDEITGETISLPGTTQATLFGGTKRFSPLILLPVLPVLILILLLGRGFNENRTLERTLASLEGETRDIRETSASPENLYSWEESHKILREALSPDYYAFLDTIYPLFRGRAQIKTLTIDGDAVHLEALGLDGLLILEDLSERSLLNELTLHQIRQDGNEEYFIISGRLP